MNSVSKLMLALVCLLSLGLLACAQSGGGVEGQVDDAVQCYVDAVNSEDLDALVDCFAPDGLIVDVSREIQGREAIRAWAEGEVIGGALEALEVEPSESGQRLLVHWAPAGSAGWRAYYTFEMQDGFIVLADLQYA